MERRREDRFVSVANFKQSAVINRICFCGRITRPTRIIRVTRFMRQKKKDTYKRLRTLN